MLERLNEELESDFYDKETLIAEVEKSDIKKIRITVGKKGNFEYVNMREFYLDGNDEWKPGKSGLNVNHEVIGSLIEGLNYAYDEIIK